MKYSIDEKGNISLLPSSKEMGILSNALQSKNLQLRIKRENPETCDVILAMLVILHNALVDSNKIKAQVKAQDGLNDSCNKTTPRHGWINRIYNFFNPPFSTSDFEGSDCFCGSLFHIESLDFEVNNSKYPYNVAGFVQYKRAWLPCTWNSHGICSCPKLGKEAYLFDLVRPCKCKATLTKNTDISIVISLLASIIFPVIQ